MNALAKITAAWNAQADEYNQWDTLSLEEMFDFAERWFANNGRMRSFTYTDPDEGGNPIVTHMTEQEVPRMAQSIREKYYSRDEAAVALGVSSRTLDRWWSLRVGPPRTKVGSQVFYRRKPIETWLLAQETAPGLF